MQENGRADEMEKWKSRIQQGKRLLAELRKDSSKEACRDLKNYLMRLFQKIRPRRLSGEIVFGFDDPADTGQVLGVLALFLPAYKDTLHIVPDFEREIFLAEGEGEGRIRLVDVLYTVLCILRNKNIMRTWHRIRRQSGGTENES